MNIYLTYISSRGAKDFLFAHTNIYDAIAGVNRYADACKKTATLRIYKVQEGMVEYLCKENVVYKTKGTLK